MSELSWPRSKSARSLYRTPSEHGAFASCSAFWEFTNTSGVRLLAPTSSTGVGPTKRVAIACSGWMCRIPWRGRRRPRSCAMQRSHDRCAQTYRLARPGHKRVAREIAIVEDLGPTWCMRSDPHGQQREVGLRRPFSPDDAWRRTGEPGVWDTVCFSTLTSKRAAQLASACLRVWDASSASNFEASSGPVGRGPLRGCCRLHAVVCCAVE